MPILLGRLKRRPEFLRVAARGRKSAAPGLVLQALRRPAGESAPADDSDVRLGLTASEPQVRLGLTASKKVGNAVARNRARRRLREAARRILPERAEPGYDVVLVARAATIARPFAALLADLETALERAGAARRGRVTAEGEACKSPAAQGGRR